MNNSAWVCNENNIAPVWISLCNVFFFGNAWIRTSDVQEKKTNSPSHVARDKYRCCNYYLLYYAVDVAWNMMLMLRWEFSIRKSDIRVICIYIFLMLQTLIFYAATIICQCCDGPFDEKISLFGWLGWSCGRNSQPAQTANPASSNQPSSHLKFEPPQPVAGGWLLNGWADQNHASQASSHQPNSLNYDWTHIC